MKISLYESFSISLKAYFKEHYAMVLECIFHPAYAIKRADKCFDDGEMMEFYILMALGILGVFAIIGFVAFLWQAWFSRTPAKEDPAMIWVIAGLCLLAYVLIGIGARLIKSEPEPRNGHHDF